MKSPSRDTPVSGEAPTVDDPQRLIDGAPMSMRQAAAVAVLIALNALDGFDVLAISFAAPGIAEEWGIGKGRLGIVLAMELVGMGLGSMLLGGVADRLGRRRTILSCLILMVAGMGASSQAMGIVSLSVWRIVTGLGIGGMLASTTACAAELSNERYRSLSVSWVAIGYPIGAVVGGTIAAILLEHFDWRSVFVLGAGMTALSIPLVLALVPEPVAWLCQKRPDGALQRVNATLTRLGHATVAALPERSGGQRAATMRDLLTGRLRIGTILVAAAYFAHITTVYFLLKWLPKISVDLGMSASEGASMLVSANIGGTIAGLIFGVATRFVPLPALVIGVMFGSAATVAALGAVEADITRMTGLAVAAGFFSSAGTVGMYATFARTFPVSVRGFGTGFAIGIGRGGAVLSPMLTGALFEAGLSLGFVAPLLGAGSLVAALALLVLWSAERRSPVPT